MIRITENLKINAVIHFWYKFSALVSYIVFLSFLSSSIAELIKKSWIRSDFSFLIISYPPHTCPVYSENTGLSLLLCTFLFCVPSLGFPGGSVVKNLPAMQETQVWSLGREDLLEKGMATHSSILAWRIPWTEKPGRLQSMWLYRVGHNWVINTLTFTALSSEHTFSLKSYSYYWGETHTQPYSNRMVHIPSHVPWGWQNLELFRKGKAWCKDFCCCCFHCYPENRKEHVSHKLPCA